MSDFLLGLRLDDIQNLLLTGTPPVVVQLLFINTLFLIAYVFRRLRKGNVTKRSSALVVQWFLLFASFAALTEQSWLPIAERTKYTVIDKWNNAMRSY